LNGAIWKDYAKHHKYKLLKFYNVLDYLLRTNRLGTKVAINLKHQLQDVEDRIGGADSKSNHASGSSDDEIALAENPPVHEPIETKMTKNLPSRRAMFTPVEVNSTDSLVAPFTIRQDGKMIFLWSKSPLEFRFKVTNGCLTATISLDAPEALQSELVLASVGVAANPYIQQQLLSMELGTRLLTIPMEAALAPGESLHPEQIQRFGNDRVEGAMVPIVFSSRQV
jgi:hypothetical protein